MPKADRILSLFPCVYGANDKSKLLNQVVHQISEPLDEVGSHLFRIQRAHRINVAETVDDIIRLAAALNMTSFHFDDLLTDKDFTYEDKLELMRQRVQRIARIHLDGLGTPWAVMEATAAFINAEIIGGRLNKEKLIHLDKDGYSHQAEVVFNHHPDKPKRRIYLHENPIRRNKSEVAERWALNHWAIENRNVEASPIKIVIRGVGERTVLPSVFCRETGEGIFFNGIIPAGSTLVINHDNGAMLDNHPVDDWLIFFKGGVNDFADYEQSEVVVDTGEEGRPFEGDVEALVSHPYRSKKPAPLVPTGRSNWRFKIAEGVYDGSLIDFAVYATEHLPIGRYDEDFNYGDCVYDNLPQAHVGMSWDERIPCAFKLVVPNGLPPTNSLTADSDSAQGAGEEDEVNNDFVGRIASIIPRFKAAGVRAYVGPAEDAWILGESVIRKREAAKGEGVEYESARLRNNKADMLMPFDPAS